MAQILPWSLQRDQALPTSCFQTLVSRSGENEAILSVVFGKLIYPLCLFIYNLAWVLSIFPDATAQQHMSGYNQHSLGQSSISKYKLDIFILIQWFSHLSPRDMAIQCTVITKKSYPKVKFIQMKEIFLKVGGAVKCHLCKFRSVRIF